MSSYIPNLLKVIEKIASNPSSNLTIQLQPYFKNLFSQEKGCNCSRIWRQRGALTLVNLEYLRQALYSVSDERANKVIEAFMTICTKNMEQINDAEFWVFPLEEILDRELLGDSLKVLCNISPKKHISTIEKLYCFKDDSNGLQLSINSKLESLIEDFPALVIDWIESFQLYKFKADNLRSLTLSCMVNNLELAKYLITNDSTKDDILSILDDYVVYDRPRPPPTNLIKNFFDKFCVSTLSTSVHKWARQWDRYDKIPNTMKYRTIKNFDHNFYTARSIDERRILTLQTVEASKHSSSHMKEIIKCVKKHANEDFAMAVATFAKEYITLKDVLEVLDDYHHISQSKQRKVDLEVQELLKLQSASQIKRIPRIKFDEFECFLVDDHETFDKLLSALWEHEDRTLAFDVEAGFVCQSEIAAQDAALLQIAFTDDTVYLVDIYTLKKVLNISEWETFFELFLRSRLRRIGFGIKNDLVFLQNAFPFLGKFFANKKPSFICVQDIVKTLSNTEETLTAVFDGKIPQVSLQYITKELLKAELKKEEQSGNWLIRPLDEQKMKYAATDAFYTLKAFFEIKERLNKEQWMELKKTIYQTCEPIKVNQPATFSLFKKKDTFEEVVAHIQNVVEELQGQSLLARKAEENTVVLEPPFLGIRGTLKRFGFKTWDHRDGINSKPDKKATEMVKEMEYFLQHLPKDQRPFTYILTNKRTISQKVMDFEEYVIYAEQEQEHSIILERIIRKTYSSIDFSSIYKRCSSCAEVTTHFEIPMAAYRTIYKSFATCRNFADNIVGLEDSLETFKDTFNSLSPELKDNCSIDSEELIVQNGENGVFRFSINGTDINVTVGSEVSTFKCDTKLFNNENGFDKQDLNDGSQDCIILYETNVREKLKETNDRLTIANKLVKKLQDEVFEHAQKITFLNSVEYKLQQKIKILEESNHTISSQTEKEKLNVLEISTKFEKLKEEAEKMKEKEKDYKKMIEEIEVYKEMAEKYIAKGDEEKEAEHRRANVAEAKNEELKLQISLLTTTNEMQKSEIIKLQAAATATSETLQTYNNNYVQPMAIDKKSRDRIKKEAINLFEAWKINYKNNKNKEIEFQIDHLKKKLKQSEIEKEREIRNGLNYTQKINNLETERLNLLQTIRKQNCQSFLTAKKSESESTKKIISEKDENANEIMKELNIVKENLSELMQQHNNFLAKADSCSSTVTSIGPKWKVSKKLCNDIWKKCHGHLKTFLEEYIDQLFSYSEKLLPEKTLEKTEKWTEVKAIIRHFFAFEGDEDENETELNLITLKEVMSVKRYPIRQEMYRNCSNFRLCAITSNDKMFYYAQDQNDKEFYVPYEDQQCQKKLECKNSSVQFGVPKQYESCPFIVIVKDDIQCQQVFKMDCNNGSAKIVWERKKNV